MTTNRLLNIDDNYFEVILNEKGFSFNKINAEQYLDKVANSILLKDAEVELAEDNFFQDIVNAAQSDLHKTLHKNIKNTVLSILGFEKDSWSGSGYKIDHCNGRMSDVTNLISDKLKAQILNVELYQDFELSVEEKAQLKFEMRREFSEKYKYEMSRLINSDAERLARKHVAEYADDLIKSKAKDLAEAMLASILTKK